MGKWEEFRSSVCPEVRPYLAQPGVHPRIAVKDSEHPVRHQKANDWAKN
jgi:hypothetical protein